MDKLCRIPFLPISFFKTHKVVIEDAIVQKVFFSSGTTNDNRSRHFVSDLSLYEMSFLKSFEKFYDSITQYAILALLPSYLENENSSLVYMVKGLIDKSKNPDSDFYLNNHRELLNKIQNRERKGEKTLLIGVSFALLDFVEKYTCRFKHTTIIETGGMKGQRKEMVREELHDIFKMGFGVDQIHSEYGMTELLSQAYLDHSQKFNCPPWMKVLIRNINDPLSISSIETTGGINVIDLANINSCSFIATQDLGRVYKNGQFDVLGRLDNSDIRGCNLLFD